LQIFYGIKMHVDSDASGSSPLNAWVRALAMTAPIARNQYVTFPIVIENLAEKVRTSVALLSDRESMTYGALAERANRYARWALAQNLAAGEVVCLLMQNCPDYFAIWLGIVRIGGIVSLVNTNLTAGALAHSINIVAPKHVIVGADLVENLTAALPQLAQGIKIWAHGRGSHGFPRVEEEIRRVSGDKLSASECRPPSIMDPALYIYTSGTTGLPKAANVSHFRLMQWTHWFAGMLDIRASDRMYNCLPMYHSIGGVVATGATLVNGGSVVIRERFSASRFWHEVVEWDCTLFQYIGELCRYLVNNPPHPLEAQHRIRLCCGNGLRPEVWSEFKRRFRIPRILEFYASTEGNFSLYNCEEELGAIGRIPPFIAHRFPVALIKFDLEAGNPVRGGDGFCIRCSANEVGEAIGKIPDEGSGTGHRFEGYRDKDASEKKILRNVFSTGDAWFRTGDLMRRDQRGYFYFVDRIGDTFRWKGENVSTAEVADTIAACPGVIDSVVYGVSVPNTDGRAGMAAIVVAEDFDLVAFHRFLAERLPEYGRPLFLRVVRELQVTGTFKPKKQDLSHEGYDPALTTDPVYFNDRDRKAFVELGAVLYERIQTGEMRL
jgi:fatty-acyl-CoA synthase